MRKNIHPLILLRATVDSIWQHPTILYPTIVLGLIQILTLEILYFAPRHPWSNFFGPLISQIWSEEFLHYPMDLILLPKLFYYMQILIYLFVGTFLLAMTAWIVTAVNNNHRYIHLKHAFRAAGAQYVHIICSSIISLIIFQLCSTGYTSLVNAVVKIKTQNANLILLQKIFVLSTPYIQFLIGIFITTLLIYVVPIIMIEKQKIFGALLLNAKVLFRSLGTSFLVVLIPTLFYLPILVARNNIEYLAAMTSPEIQLFIIGLSIIVTLAIDVIILTTVTVHYLFLKEE